MKDTLCPALRPSRNSRSRTGRCATFACLLGLAGLPSSYAGNIKEVRSQITTGRRGKGQTVESTTLFLTGSEAWIQPPPVTPETETPKKPALADLARAQKSPRKGEMIREAGVIAPKKAKPLVDLVPFLPKLQEVLKSGDLAMIYLSSPQRAASQVFRPVQRIETVRCGDAYDCERRQTEPDTRFQCGAIIATKRHFFTSAPGNSCRLAAR